MMTTPEVLDHVPPPADHGAADSRTILALFDEVGLLTPLTRRPFLRQIGLDG